MMYLHALLYAATFIGCIVYLNRARHQRWIFIGAFAATAAGSFGCFIDAVTPQLHNHAWLWDLLYQGGAAAVILLHFGFDRRAAALKNHPFERRFEKTL